METGRALAQVKPTTLNEMPIRLIDDKNKNDNTLKKEVIKNVDLLEKIFNEISESRLQTKVYQLKSRIDYCISKIDEAVYKLYDLTEEEIKIIENN